MKRKVETGEVTGSVPEYGRGVQGYWLTEETPVWVFNSLVDLVSVMVVLCLPPDFNY